MYDVAIIGAGVIGATIFRELSRYNVKVILIEKENDVAMGTTKANSAIVHAGYDPENGTLMAKYNVKGNELFEGICSELSVPFLRNGALVIAKNDEEMTVINKLYENGIKNEVKKLSLLNSKEVLKLEPNISKNIVGALYAPTSGIVCPYEFTIANVENAISNGGELKLNSKVTFIKKEGNFKIGITDNTVIESKFVVNAAGVNADDIHNLICKSKIKITGRKGEYFVMDKNQGKLIQSTIFPCPSKVGKGILITPTVNGNLLVGPNANDIEDKCNLNTNGESLDYIKSKAIDTLETLNFRETIRNFAGIRAMPEGKDFIIGEDLEHKGFIDVAGMKSPGLSCAPAIAIDVLDMLEKSGLETTLKDTFIKERKVIRFAELSIYEKNELIKRDSRYGRIICRCEEVTEGEIVDAISRSFGKISVDGIKRRCRPGMGRCQGGFCAPKIQEIIAREQQVNMEDINLDREGTKILIGRTK